MDSFDNSIEYKGYTIKLPSSNFGPPFLNVIDGRDLYIIGSFALTKGNDSYIFTFGVNTVALDFYKITKDELTGRAISVIKRHIDSNELKNKEYFYDYILDEGYENANDFQELTSPIWKTPNS